MDEPKNSSTPDFSNPDELEKIVPGFGTIKNWKETSASMYAPMEYVEGQQHVVTVLAEILGHELPFEEMKKQLTGLVGERLQFIKYAYDQY